MTPFRWTALTSTSDAERSGIRFMDPDGVGWTVSEHDGHLVPGSRGAHFLLFSSESVMRRVWDYPVDWRTLDDDDLAGVSWGR